MTPRNDLDSLPNPSVLGSAAATLVFALGLLASGPAHAALPTAVNAELRAIANLCREVGGKPDVAAALLRADLNGDGRKDYVVDVGGARCDGAAGIYGDREKGVSIFVTDAKGNAVKAFSDSSFAVRLEGGSNPSTIWLTVMGRGCGKAPARDFANEHFCERALRWNPKTRSFDYAAISTVRPLSQ